MFKIFTKQFSDGSYYPMKNVPDHITNATTKHQVVRWVEECRKGAMRAGYKIERA